MKKQTKSNALSSFIIFCVVGLVSVLIVIGIFVYTAMSMSDSEWEYDQKREKDCIELRLSKGYPENIAREYCMAIGGCVKKEYEENCDPELYCCFATVEEDKKWNYLDYDENGNKIEK